MEMEGRVLSSTATAMAGRAGEPGPGRAGGARCAEPGTAPLPAAAAATLPLHRPAPLSC